MAFLSWTSDYLIGDPRIDAEHRELFRLINAFHDQWIDARDRRDIALALTQLVRYAEDHFQHEEAAMAAAGFPELEQHRRTHEDLFHQIFRLHEEYASGEGRIELHTTRFMRSWLVDHIVHADYRFRDFLAKRVREGDARQG